MSPRVLTRALVVLAAAQVVYLVVCLALYSENVPFSDQWEFVPLLAKTFDGTATLGDFWEQHNEHRLFFPELLMAGLARLTHWSIACERALNVVLATLSLALLAWQSRRFLKTLEPWVVAALAILIFSQTQWENWIWGWQCQIFLSVLACQCALALLVHNERSTGAVAIAALSGAVASYSFATGLLVWPLGAALLLEDRKRLGAWLVVAAVVALAYFHGYQKPANSPAVARWTQFLGCSFYALKVLGLPIWNRDDPGTPLAGGVGLVLLGWALRRLKSGRPWKETLRELAPALALVGYGLGAAVLVSLGRGSFHAFLSTSPRYATLTTPFWLGLVLLLARNERLRLTAAILGLSLLSSLGGSLVLHNWYKPKVLEPTREALLTGKGDRLRELGLVAPSDDVEARIATLRRLRLALFKDL